MKILLFYAGITFVLNLIFSKRSQIDAWCEANPKTAAVAKFLRGAGVDPWAIWQAVVVAFTAELPGYQKQSLDQLKTPKPPILPIIMCGWLLGLLVLLCCSGGCRSTIPPKPCPLALEAEYTRALVAECADADSIAACKGAAKITAEHQAEQEDAGCRVGN